MKKEAPKPPADVANALKQVSDSVNKVQGEVKQIADGQKQAVDSQQQQQESIARQFGEVAELQKAESANLASLKQAVQQQNDTAKEQDESAKMMAATVGRVAAIASAASPAPPLAPRKPLGDYIPCLFERADDAFLRGQSFSDRVQMLVGQQMTLGRLDAGKRGQVVAALVSAYNANASSSNAVVDLVPRLFTAQLLHLGPTDVSQDQVIGEIQQKLAVLGGAAQVSSSLDVGCSQSLLSWDEARDIFGTRIANTYLVVQVVVRNLNSNEEFLMHDVQIALDARTLPVSVKFGSSNLDNTRFVAGRDKMLARGVAMIGQQMDARNFFIRLAEALGDVTLAAATATGRAHFIDGVSIYKSVLVPGLKSVYPDLTINQLNSLNDLGFSASSSYKIVVPKNGSVPFVTFLPAKIFAGPPYPSSTTSTVQRSADSWQYKKWTQEEMLLLQESLYVVFAGVHVVEDTGNPTIAKLDCPSTGGYLDLSKATADANKVQVLACPVTGTGLKAGMSLSLRTNDSTITQTIDTSLNVTSDTAGSASFKFDDLDGAQIAKYTLYLVTSSGAQPTTFTVKFQPVLSADVATAASCTGSTAVCSFTVKGTNLGLIKQIGLREAGQSIDKYLTQTVAVGTAKSGSLAVNVNQKVSANAYNLWLYYSGQSVPVDSGKTLTVQP